jgi:hypothetical protein
MAAGQQAGVNHEDGINIGPAVATQKAAFWGVTPIVQPASAVQINISGFTSASFATSAGFAAMIALLSNMRDSLVALGLIKGGA